VGPVEAKGVSSITPNLEEVEADAILASGFQLPAAGTLPLQSTSYKDGGGIYRPQCSWS
jgi:hypothetical protein